MGQEPDYNAQRGGDMMKRFKIREVETLKTTSALYLPGISVTG